MAKKKKVLRKLKSAAKRAGSRLSTSSRPKVVVRPKGRSSLLGSLGAGTLGRKHLDSRSAGQSGDIQGLSNAEEVDSESVEELVEEGQGFEAGVILGVEEAGARQEEVRAKEVLEDDVPLESLDND